jgi:hypothetical protein
MFGQFISYTSGLVCIWWRSRGMSATSATPPMLPYSVPIIGKSCRYITCQATRLIISQAMLCLLPRIPKSSFHVEDSSTLLYLSSSTHQTAENILATLATFSRSISLVILSTYLRIPTTWLPYILMSERSPSTHLFSRPYLDHSVFLPTGPLPLCRDKINTRKNIV